MIVSLFGIHLFYQDGQIYRKKEPDDLVNQSVSRLLQHYVKVGLMVKKVEKPTFLPIINVAIQCFH
jgi:nitrate reductase assembly molybdenum cofactor insertion protein NarJ